MARAILLLFLNAAIDQQWKYIEKNAGSAVDKRRQKYGKKKSGYMILLCQGDACRIQDRVMSSRRNTAWAQAAGVAAMNAPAGSMRK